MKLNVCNCSSLPMTAKRKSTLAASIAIALAAVISIALLVSNGTSLAFATTESDVAISGESKSILGSNRTFTTSWGEEIESSASSVHADKRTLTQEDLVNIASMKNLSSLSLMRCDFSACDFGAVTFASQDFVIFDLRDSSGIDDYSFLSSLTIDELLLSGCSSFDDLSVVDKSSLSKLYLDDTEIEDLDAIVGSSLQWISINNTSVDSLDPLKGMTTLYRIDADNTAITNIDPLLDLESLGVLNLSGCALEEPHQPLASLSLTEINLSNTGISDFTLIGNCTALEKLDVSDNPNLDRFTGDEDAASLDPQNQETLTWLNLANTNLASDDIDGNDDGDAAWLGSCTNLTTLILDGSHTENLGMCSKLANLEHISAVGCGITDIEGLSGCPKLVTAQLAGNSISSVSAFANLEEIKPNDTVIDLSFNNLESVESLPAGDYEALLLYGNAQDIALTVPEEVSCYEIIVPWCEGIEKSALVDSDSSTNVYIVDCPDDQVQTIDESYENHRVRIIDKSELPSMLDDGYSFVFTIDVDCAGLISILEE